jgi:methionine salvage enolase-phosphatase E1
LAFTANMSAVQCFLLDIEGTTTSISFVKVRLHQ